MTAPTPPERQAPPGATAAAVQRVYLTLLTGNTLAASFIWGINTLFLLDAGLSNLEAFAANAFFTAGMVLFEVPTGVVADTWGRRASYLLGTVTLAVATLLYYLMWQLGAPFWAWALVSLGIGLGFTFFSGAVEAWLVDALHATGYEGTLEAVLGRGQVATGVAMLGGSVLGGVVAQATSLGVPFLARVGVLLAMFAVAYRLMHDLGFTPRHSAEPLREVRQVLSASIEHGLGNRPVRYVMLAAPFDFGSGCTCSTRCSRTCSSCGATRGRTRLPGWPRRSWPRRRSSAGWPRRGCAGCSGAGPRR